MSHYYNLEKVVPIPVLIKGVILSMNELYLNRKNTYCKDDGDTKNLHNLRIGGTTIGYIMTKT